MLLRSLVLLLLMSVVASGQSGRSIGPSNSTVSMPATVKEMFDEVNGYTKAKFNEFAAKKIKYSDALAEQTKREQKALAARYSSYASYATSRKGPAGDDDYYLGLLFWIAGNDVGTISYLSRYVANVQTPVERVQTARSIIAVTAAQSRRFDEAERSLADYLARQPQKQTERSRMEVELAKAYQAAGDFAKQAPHAVAAYASAKELLNDASSRARGMDEILDSGMMVFEAYRDLNDRVKAEAALDDMRATAITSTSPSFYYFSVDQKIQYLTETGRKTAAGDFYKSILAIIDKDFLDKGQREDARNRLERREKHYALLGSPALEFVTPDREWTWFPGKARSLADMRGKVVVLDFWATWCRPCFDAFPHFREWSELYGKDGLEFIGLTRIYGPPDGLPADPNDEIAIIKSVRDREKLPYDIAVARDQYAQLIYGAMGLPTVVIIDRKGIIRYIETGTSKYRTAQMESMIKRLIAEK